MLQQVDAHHGDEWILRAPTPLAAFGVMLLDQRNKAIPGHNALHLRKELLALGLLLGAS